MFRLDYFSCVLTIASTILVGRRMWQGWIVAAVNSVIICVIAFRTTQMGLLPANVFCIGIYAYNVATWRTSGKGKHSPAQPPFGTLDKGHAPATISREPLVRIENTLLADERALWNRDRILPSELQHHSGPYNPV